MTLPVTERTALAKTARATRIGSAGWMIQRIAAQLNAAMKTRLAELDLTFDQFILMMTLAEGDGVTQTELGGRVGMAGYTVTRALDGLAAGGLVARRADKTSRRAHNVVLTEAGRSGMSALFAAVEAENAALLAPLDTGERADFLRLLTRLAAASQVKSAC